MNNRSEIRRDELAGMMTGAGASTEAG